MLDRFLREIRAVAKLRHPNIVTAYHATRLGESIVFAMEYVQGLDLSKMVKAKGPLPVAHACYFVYQAALGPPARPRGRARPPRHQAGQPDALRTGRTRRRSRSSTSAWPRRPARRRSTCGLTSEGQALGTPDYIAPEQIIDAPSADIRADIYSLGGTLYHLLTGRPPFQANSLYDMFQAHISRDADLLNFVRPEVPAELAALVAKMMAKDPARDGSRRRGRWRRPSRRSSRKRMRPSRAQSWTSHSPVGRARAKRWEKRSQRRLSGRRKPQVRSFRLRKPLSRLFWSLGGKA